MTEITGPFSPKKLSLPPKLETDRLLLLPYGEDDFDYHWELRSDADVMEHFPKVADDREALLAEFLEELNEKQHYKFFYCVSLKDESGLQPSTNKTKSIGTVLLRPTKDGEEVELGYMLAKRAWGQGIIPEACKAIIDFGFKVWDLPYIMAVISPENKKSERVIEKLGFRFSEVITDDERAPELNKFILDKSSWIKGQKS